MVRDGFGVQRPEDVKFGWRGSVGSCGVCGAGDVAVGDDDGTKGGFKGWGFAKEGSAQ